jgi:hypothetical protein
LDIDWGWTPREPGSRLREGDTRTGPTNRNLVPGARADTSPEVDEPNLRPASLDSLGAVVPALVNLDEKAMIIR